MQASKHWLDYSEAFNSLSPRDIETTAFCNWDNMSWSDTTQASRLSHVAAPDDFGWLHSTESLDPLPSDVDENNGKLQVGQHLLANPASQISAQSHFTQQQSASYQCELSGFDGTVSNFLAEVEFREEGRSTGSRSRAVSHLDGITRTTSPNYSISPWSLTQGALSPFSIDQSLSNSFHRHLTSSNLVKIYHDVLEHHLSCWLVEMTCPYRQSLDSASVAALAPEWKTSWTNRILQRTVRLDNIANSYKVLDMTPSEQKAASNALKLAVLAFATQWAQGSARARRRHSDSSQRGALGSSEDEFDRTLQRYFWTNAHRALQDVTELDSYQVACAEIIFSMAQRPWENAQQAEPETETQSWPSIRSQVQHIIHRDGPPTYAERAARRMHALKAKCDSINKGFRSKDKQLNHGITAMAREDRDTIGLLYWLAIMFDTVAAAMYERPIVVVDEECRYDVQRGVESCNGATGSYRWNYEVFLRTDSEICHRTQWPCSYEEAAKDIMTSGPVKVLLFRHVSYLQSALRQSAPGRQLEDMIFNAALIYDYWNRRHGVFFKEMVQDFPNVPQRIRDVIEFIDDNDLGLEDAKNKRLAAGMVARMRENSTLELAGLGNVATIPSYVDAPPESPEFHPALNDGTILTEPWTMILIRAFSKASILSLEEAENMRDARGTSTFVVGFKNKLQEAESCIKALCLLGKKSDMAGDLAEALQHAMINVRTGFIRHMM
ncbi:uncharacterized protein FSUBG_10955 [Fusarium subglutinans]|uniref:Regulatory protein alcR n=1 Tax=Gibberella subglutinans TaxID=42677 RepID=A0A8H5LF03_GIBSU|nr:uncharacterized protein FSUBG_10955 [Fusarium subglutinans]KAF5590117.1 hypothetical protein FSUBG_10955 [Fusarium subglutinans]